MWVGSADNRLNSVELLNISANSTLPAWTLCTTKFPFIVCAHTLTSVELKNDQFVNLTGGYVDWVGYSKRVWKGTLNSHLTDVVWEEMKGMVYARRGHIAFFLGQKLVVAGGHNENTSEIFDFNTNNSIEGPKLPCSQFGGACVTVKGNIAIITGGRRGLFSSCKIMIYSHENGFKDLNIKLPEGLFGHVALLQ